MANLKPDLKDVVDTLNAQNLFDWDGLDAEAVRLRFAEVKVVPELPDVPMIVDIEAPGPHGPVPCRLLHPSPGTPVPLLVWMHGGGWVLGSLEQEEATARRIALHGGIAVLNVDYRLAPEHPFPAAHDDACAAYDWACTHAQDFDIRPDAIGVGGGSAGGNLAATVSLSALKDRRPVPKHQALVYPVAACDFDTPSMTTFADGPVLTRSHMYWFWDQYVPNIDDRRDWRCTPMSAATLQGMPSTTLLLADNDPLLDDGLAFAQALRGAGVEVDLTVAEGMCHGFQGMASAVPSACTQVERFIDTIAAALST